MWRRPRAIRISRRILYSSLIQGSPGSRNTLVSRCNRDNRGSPWIRRNRDSRNIQGSHILGNPDSLGSRWTHRSSRRIPRCRSTQASRFTPVSRDIPLNRYNRDNQFIPVSQDIQDNPFNPGNRSIQVSLFIPANRSIQVNPSNLASRNILVSPYIRDNRLIRDNLGSQGNRSIQVNRFIQVSQHIPANQHIQANRCYQGNSRANLIIHSRNRISRIPARELHLAGLQLRASRIRRWD